MISPAMVSSESIEWQTPRWLYEKLDAEFEFTRDVCASTENHQHEIYWTKSDNALSQQWNGTLWMNPPYGRGIGAWIKKAYESAQNGATVVCLVPARVDARWFQNYCTAGEIRFLNGRLKFKPNGVGGLRNGGLMSAPFPCAVVIFHGYLDPGEVCKFWKPEDGLFGGAE